MHVKAAELSTAMQLREHLAWVKQAIRVESAFQTLLMRQVGFVEHCFHKIAFFDADTVLTSQHAANLDAESQNIGSKGLSSLDLVRLIGVVKNQRMEIAVARMEHVDHRKAVPVR